MRKSVSAALGLVAAAAVVALPGAPAYAADVNVTVDFTKAVAHLDPAKNGLTVTGYGNQHYITNDAKHAENVRRQGFGTMRIELAYNAEGKLVCGGDWCDTAVPGDDWITAIRGLGGTPMLILPADGRRTLEADVADAKNIYSHFAATGTPIRSFIYGNELDNGGNPKHMDASVYSARFNAVYDALHALDAQVKVGGPALGSYEAGNTYMEAFLAGSGTRTDFVDYHDYAAGRERKTPEQLLAEVPSYTRDIEALKAQIARVVPARAGAIPVQLGEWNMDYEDPEGTLMLSHLATVWGSAAFGQILASGASSILYGDKNGNALKNNGLGITSTEGEGGIAVSDPTPIYHGLGMFTGEGVFRGFGSTVVSATSSNAAVYPYASNGAKNVVLVNTATTATSTSLSLNGYASGSAAVWQSTGDSQATWAPHAAGTVAVTGGAASVVLPARSVTTLVLAEQGLKGEYFAGTALAGTPVLSRVDPGVGFDWGQGSPDPAVSVDNFSVRWTGQVDVPRADTYTFIATTDDGSRLWVDGKLIVDAWTDHSKRDDMGSVALTAGKHQIRFEYYEKGYDAIAQLGWSSPNLARETIPAGRLTPG